MVSKTSKPALLGVAIALLLRSASAAVNCSGTFKPISASDFVARMDPGWNLGNTLDAVETEGSWNNPPVVPATFDDMKASGYKGIRLPVTWAYHFKSQSPDWTVDPVWLQRVSDVVDMITDRGFYTIVNVHHDSWIWMDITASGANLTMIEERFYKLWYQIGTKLACKGSQVAFEPINEIPGTTEEHGKEINKLNEIFLQAIKDSGGWNGQRVVTLVGAGEDGAKTSQWFKRPDESKFKNPWAIQYHYYSPYDFIFGAWGKTIWGSASDKAALETDLALVRGNFTDVPLIIGEWAASATHTETAARWKYFDFFLRTAKKYKTATVIWDNGADFFNRGIRQWRDTVAQDILINVASGNPNTLPASTEDAGAESQSSDAYVYWKTGETYKDTTITLEMNGNVLEYAKLVGQRANLRPETDYSFALLADQKSGTVTFKKSFLASIFAPKRDSRIRYANETGPKANVTLTFNAGADLLINFMAWNTPKLGVTTSKLVTGKDLLVPVEWKGQNRPAAIRAVKKDGGYLVDDWTQWLGPLQRGRLVSALSACFCDHLMWEY
jgi:endoglucanase